MNIVKQIAIRIQAAAKLASYLPDNLQVPVTMVNGAYIVLIRKGTLIYIRYGTTDKFEQIVTSVDAKMAQVAKQACAIMQLDTLPENIKLNTPHLEPLLLELLRNKDGGAFTVWLKGERVNALYNDGVITTYREHPDYKYDSSAIIHRVSIAHLTYTNILKDYTLYN